MAQFWAVFEEHKTIYILAQGPVTTNSRVPRCIRTESFRAEYLNLYPVFGTHDLDSVELRCRFLEDLYPRGRGSSYKEQFIAELSGIHAGTAPGVYRYWMFNQFVARRTVAEFNRRYRKSGFIARLYGVEPQYYGLSLWIPSEAELRSRLELRSLLYGLEQLIVDLDSPAWDLWGVGGCRAALKQCKKLYSCGL